MTRLAAGVERSRLVEAHQEEVWKVVGDETRFGGLVPDVEAYTPTDDGWHFVLRPAERMGATIQPRFTVRYEKQPPEELRFFKVDRPGDSADASGACILSGGGPTTDVVFRLDIAVDLPVPALLAGPVRTMLASEITRLADGFLDNLGEAVRRPG
jgi:carbon monoxide dehydrogenase subunit G